MSGHGQIAMPVPISPGRSNNLQAFTPKDLYASLNDNLAAKPSFLALKERDFIVPAPPPPSPVSFRMYPDQRPKPPRV